MVKGIVGSTEEVKTVKANKVVPKRLSFIHLISLFYIGTSYRDASYLSPLSYVRPYNCSFAQLPNFYYSKRLG